MKSYWKSACGFAICVVVISGASKFLWRSKSPVGSWIISPSQPFIPDASGHPGSVEKLFGAKQFNFYENGGCSKGPWRPQDQASGKWLVNGDTIVVRMSEDAIKRSLMAQQLDGADLNMARKVLETPLRFTLATNNELIVEVSTDFRVKYIRKSVNERKK